MNFHDLDNFNLADAVKFHSRLNPRIWGSDEHLLPEVREKLLAIAADFQEFLGVDDLKVQDLTISGSNAAYSYTPHSDIDLHLVVEMPDDPVYQELFNAKKYQYNDEHDIRIGGVPVELYVQPADQKHVSQGIYSVKNGEWTQVPQRRRAKIDDSCVQHKAADLDARIHSAIKSGDADAINRLLTRIKTMRQTSLEKNGEFGCENIAYKLLRNMGCIDKLWKAKAALRDRELSLEQSKKPRERKKVNYGMRDYWYPGTAYAGQDHPAGTETEQVDEAVSGPRIVVVGDSIAVGIAQAAGLPYEAVVGRNTRQILDAAAANPQVQGADLAIVSAGTNDYAILKGGGKNPNRKATIQNIGRIRDVLKARQYVWILPFYETARDDVLSAIGGDAYVSLADVATTGDRLHPKNYKAVANAALSKSVKEDITENVDPDQLKKILHRFYNSCVSKLELENPPRLRLETTPEWSKDNGSFGQYEPESNTLILATSGRHVLDILRTMAHEMTHRQQDEHEPLPADAGETGSPYEDQANAMAGRIMRQWAEEQPDMFDGATLEEASGYIPTKKQARDPRFVMALTKDVQPGAVGKEANKLGLQTDSQGHPALLTAGLQKLLREFKEQDLFEINMGGKNLRREAAKTGALAGMEFEMIVPDTGGGDDDEQEPDYDEDERASSPSDIRDFFYDGEYNSRRSVDSLIDSMMSDYGNWQVEAFGDRWDSDSEQFIYDYIKENMDDDDVREMLGLEEEDPISRNEYQLAADKIAAEQIEPWYEDAKNDASDSFFEDDRFEEWLSDSGLTHMSDIERSYSGYSDIQWPHWRSVGNDSETSVQDVARSFSAAVGRPAKASTTYHDYGMERPAPGKNFYVVEPDGSLKPDDSNDAGLEFVSPPLPIDEMMSDLNKVKKWADQNGCYTNDSTGLHINISVPNYDLDRLDFVKLALLMGDEYVLDQFGRASNTYAKSAMGKVRDHVRQRPYEAKYLLDKMKGHMGELASKAIHSGSTEKFTSINTRDGHVEFRSPGGDWLDDNFSKIENTLLRFTVALSAAMDPAAYREEYLKKLYKTLNAGNDKGDLVNMFARYSAGLLPAYALKSFVRQVQAERKAKKSGEAIVNGHRWRVSLKPELGGGAVEVMATDPIDAKKQAIIQQPNWRFVDDSALTIERLDEPAAGTSTNGPHPEGRGRPNDPNGQLAIVRRDDPLVFAYSSGTPSAAPDYLFRFTLGDGYSQAQLRSVLAAWAARENANAADYMIVDTTQFAAPEQTAAPAASQESNQGTWGVWVTSLDRFTTTGNRTQPRRFRWHADAQAWIQDHNARNPGNELELSVREIPPETAQAAPESGSVQWNIIDRNNNTVHTFWNRNVQADANAVAREWLMTYNEWPLVDGQGPFEVVPAAIPGSTLDLQRQRMAASQVPTPIAGVQDIEPDVEQYTSQPAQTQWEVYDRSTDQPVFRMYAANNNEAWRKGQEWVANYARMTPDQEINAANYSVRQSAKPVSESRENDNPVAQKIFFARSDKAPKGWSYDHVGFITQDGRQIQMSGHKGNSVYVTNTVTDDPEFPKQKIKIVSLSKPVSVPTTNAVGAENCGTFVAKVLQANGIKGITTQKIYSVFKSPQGQVRAPANLPNHTFNHEQGYRPGPTPPQIKPMQIVPSMIKEQDVSESREITKLGKLDSVLEKCIEMIRRGYETDPEKYGRVAACLIDNKNNHTYAINMPGPDGTRRHAERMAIDKHLESHGRIGPNAIMITTLSPCVDHMDERYGESCTDLLSDYGIEKCYAGWQDPTQHPAEDYPFNLQVTDNADIFNTCKDIAASFLPQAMAEAYTGPQMKFLKPGELSGSYSPQQMQAMGFKQSSNGSWYIPMNMWQRLVSGGQIRENFADGRNPQDKGDSKRHGVPTKASVSTLRKVAKQGGRKGQLAHWMANMKAGRAKAKRKTNEDNEFVDTISPGLVADWDDQAGQIRYTKNNVVIPYGTAEYNAARAQHVEYRKKLKYNKLKQTTDPVYNQIRSAFEKEQQSPTKPGAAIVVPQEMFPQDTIKPPVKYDDPTDDDFVAEDYESMVEAVDQQTVSNFTTRANGVLETIAQNADPKYQKAIRKIPVKILNGNPSNPAYVQGDTVHMDAEEWWDAPSEVLLFVMAHEVGHVLFEHGIRWPWTPPATIQSDQQEEMDGDKFALQIVKKLGIKKIPVWTWLRRKKNDLEEYKRRQESRPPGPWPTFKQRSDQALGFGVELVKANTDQIDHALEQIQDMVA